MLVFVLNVGNEKYEKTLDVYKHCEDALSAGQSEVTSSSDWTEYEVLVRELKG